VSSVDLGGFDTPGLQGGPDEQRGQVLQLEQARRVRKGVDVLAGDKAVADGEAVDAVPLDQRGLLVAKS
jgi:hypothetical protein